MVQIFVVGGLSVDIVGVFILSWGLLISKKEAIKLGIPRVGGMTDEENLKLPQVKDRLRMACNAKVGLALIALGFALQIVGNLTH